MSDRTSAGLFATIFETLVRLQEEKALSPILARDVAAKFWPLQRDYDFSPYQMSCDDALITLGLAKKFRPGTDEECIAYLGSAEFEADS